MKECKSCPYDSIESLPDALLFKNRFLSQPATEETYNLIYHLYHYHRNDLKFLHTECQRYKDYGGAHQISFTNWLKKIKAGLNDFEKDNK